MAEPTEQDREKATVILTGHHIYPDVYALILPAIAQALADERQAAKAEAYQRGWDAAWKECTLLDQPAPDEEDDVRAQGEVK